MIEVKSILIDCLNTFISTKLTSKRQNVPGLDKSLRKAIRKKARLYNRAKLQNDLTFGQNTNYRNGARSAILDVPVGPINDKLLTSLETLWK